MVLDKYPTGVYLVKENKIPLWGIYTYANS